ncbi:MAG: methyltransferase domain-containing protein [Alphaproteobacteria bacterium]|nr:methyltransferase domain-containing protein [Alphaproteobacteria bacterium]
MNPNLKQIEHWNGPAGHLWASRHETNEIRLANVHNALMAFAAPQRGDHVLDVGCGCGWTALALAEVVAPGKVIGLDVSAPMLDTARLNANAEKLDVDFIEADASIHPFAPEFDLVFSRFGVMFFTHPVEAFANIRKALKPGGRLAFVCWRAFPENPWAYAPVVVARDLLPLEPPQDPRAPGQFAFADDSYVCDILAGAGFCDIRIERCDVSVNLGVDLDEAANDSLNTGALSRAAASLDTPTRDAIRKRVRTALEPYATTEGVSPPSSCWLVGAAI